MTSTTAALQREIVEDRRGLDHHHQWDSTASGAGRLTWRCDGLSPGRSGRHNRRVIPMSPGAPKAAPANEPPRLRWHARLLLIVCFAFGVVTFAYVGLVVGFEVAAAQAQKVPPAPPTRGIGLAPDLSGLLQLAEQGVILGGVVLFGIASGTVAGCVVMWILCRHVIARQLRAYRCLARR
jgi:hypothetical protein